MVEYIVSIENKKELDAILNKKIYENITEKELLILKRYLKINYEKSFFEFEKNRGYESDPFSLVKIKDTQKILKSIDVKNILTIGSGLGVLEKEIDEEYKIISTDISENTLRYQKGKALKHTLLLADGCFLPFQDSYFDLVICLEVLEHLPEPIDAILEISRVAKKHIIISYPTDFTWSYTRFGVLKNPYLDITIRDAINFHLGHISVKKCQLIKKILSLKKWKLTRQMGYHSLIPPDFKWPIFIRKFIRQISGIDYFFSGMPIFRDMGIDTLYYYLSVKNDKA